MNFESTPQNTNENTGPVNYGRKQEEKTRWETQRAANAFCLRKGKLKPNTPECTAAYLDSLKNSPNDPEVFDLGEVN